MHDFYLHVRIGLDRPTMTLLTRLMGDRLTDAEKAELNEAAFDLANTTSAVNAAIPGPGVPLFKGVRVMANQTVQAAIASMQQAKSVEQAVLGFFQTGFPAALEKAKQDAIANGATADELAPLDALSADLASQAQPILDAILAGTPVTTAQAKATK